MAVNLTPGFDLQPSAQQVPVSTNYITNFDFLNQYLPDTYEKEFERLLQKGIQNNISSYSFDSLGAGPKTAQKIAYEREEAARKNKALELQKEKLEKVCQGNCT